MASTEQRQAAVQRLGELIKGIRFAMLTTVGDHGSLHSRPMATQQVEFDGHLWFFTDEESAKVHEVREDSQVCLAYGDPAHNRYVSVSGVCRVVRDRQKIKELWNPLYKAWFPEGLDDPKLCLLRVDVERAEYWDSPSSKMVQLVGFAKAVLTGQRADNVGEHGTLELSAQE